MPGGGTWLSEDRLVCPPQPGWDADWGPNSCYNGVTLFEFEIILLTIEFIVAN